MKQIAKKCLAGLVLALAAATTAVAGTNELALIPLPQKVQQLDGAFTLNARTRIYANWHSRKTAEFLAQRLRKSTGFPLKVHWKLFPGSPRNAILFTTKHASRAHGNEAYALTVLTNEVVIRA
ncbi:MAG: glycoside hydrolase family 20 zincin-like fold domain-containing protein, partial [Limisphaerales bacterium]